MKKKLFLTMLTLTVAVALLAGGTMAWFTDTDDAGTATFTAGILDVDVSDSLSGFYEEYKLGTISHMNPGDVYEPITINITNKGNKRLAWFGDWQFNVPEGSEDDIILDAMYIHSMKMEFLKPDGTEWEPADLFIQNGVGAGTYKAAIDSLIDPDWGVINLRKWNDNNLMTTTSPLYEHMGALMPGYSYRLTVQFGFNSKADNDYQGKIVNVAFNVVSTQVHKGALDDEIGNGKSVHYDWLIQQLVKQGYQQQ